MPSTATVDAHILENHDASVEINRRFRSKASLAFPTSHVALFSHALKGMLEPMDGLLVKTMGSHIQNSGHVDERGRRGVFLSLDQVQQFDDPTDFYLLLTSCGMKPLGPPFLWIMLCITNFFSVR